MKIGIQLLIVMLYMTNTTHVLSAHDYKVLKSSQSNSNQATNPSKPLFTFLTQSNQRHDLHQSHLSHADYYLLDKTQLKKVLDDRPSFFRQSLTIRGKRITISFEKINILAPGFKVTTNTGKIIYPDTEQMLHYRGQIEGDDQSWVSISLDENEISYLITSRQGNYEISKTNNELYTGYYSKDQLKTTPYNSVHDADEAITKSVDVLNVNSGARSGNCIEVYIEVDNFTRTQLGGTPNTTTWVRRVFANVVSVYSLHQVPLVISQINIWETPDPYASINDISGVRNLFVTTLQNNYTGRLAHLFTLRNLGGGIANGIGGYCNSYPTYPGPQCISTSLSSAVTNFPNYSFNTYVIAHEMGHVLGLRHTHACVWNNAFVQVDDCGNVYATNSGDTPEGASCYNVSNPILPSAGGTIMSNCNLLGGIGINLSEGFGDLPGKLLYQKYVYASCLTGNICDGLAPINDLCSNAITLTINNSCVVNTFTNLNATATNGPPPFSCGNPGPTIKDVWFRLTMPSSGSVTIQTSQSGSGLTDVIIQTYTGSCGSLVALSCDDNSGPDNHAQLTLTGQTAGSPIFIRLVDTGGNDEGPFNICAYDSSIPCHPDFNALVALYNGTGGSNWVNKTGWQAGAAGTNCNVCTWFGVTCNDFGRVSSINLSSNNLVASSLPATMSNLTFLMSLRLYNNSLSGNIPSFFGSFSFLETLDLGKNAYTGALPSYLGNINSLKNLYVDQNLLTGSLPQSLTNINLSLLYVNNNNFTGCYPSGYLEFCSKSYNFSNNPSLAGGITFSSYCSTNGNGGDQDSDGYCKTLGDCNDNDNTMFPGNPEVCDLKDNNCNNLIDDIASPQTNTWIGGSGNWNVPTNWSLGQIPQRCQNVIIDGANGIVITVISNVVAEARSITILNGKSVVIQNNAQLSINYGLNLVNSGSIINNGTLRIHNILDNALFGLSNSGTILNESTGLITIQNSGVRSFFNNVGGTLTNNGQLTIDGNASNGTSGVYNQGALTNRGSFTVKNINGNEVIIVPGAMFTNQTSGVLSIE